MRVVVDEMPKGIYGCLYFREVEDGSCICLYNPDIKYFPACGKNVNDCPYFVAFKDCFKNERRK